MKSLRKLCLEKNNISVLPREILSCAELTELHLGNNKCVLQSYCLDYCISGADQLPDQTFIVFWDLPKMPRKCDIGHNLISEPNWTDLLNELPNTEPIPEELKRIIMIHNLIMGSTCFRITELPVELGYLKNLRKLMIYKNELSEIPEEIGKYS